MRRRNLLQLALCAVAASAMEVCGWEGVVATAEATSFRTAPIYVHDFRTLWEFIDFAEEQVNDLKKSLPKDQRFKFVWRNEFDKATNPNGTVGCYEAVPIVNDREISTIDVGWFIEALELSRPMT